MKSFSQRMGLKPIKSIVQSDSMDDDLRNRLWNLLITCYWEPMKGRLPSGKINEDHVIKSFLRRMWHDYFGDRIDSISSRWRNNYEKISQYFFESEWNEVYDFIECIVCNWGGRDRNKKFMRDCNKILERELSAYRFIGGKIAPITSKEEIAEIEKAVKVPISPVKEHLNTALALFSDKKNPDYRNSIKESISAVESLCKLIAGDEKATLGTALSKLEGNGIELHSALKGGFNKLYGYTNDADGIRHALLEESNLDSEDARLMLILCSAFINYLSSKATKAGIEIKV